jgi:hypothetical protein
MSYSFSVTADTKAIVKRKIETAFERVVSGQADHAKDKSAAVAVAYAMVDLLKEPQEEEQIDVRMHGSLSWRAESAGDLTFANVNVSVSVVAK